MIESKTHCRFSEINFQLGISGARKQVHLLRTWRQHCLQTVMISSCGLLVGRHQKVESIIKTMQMREQLVLQVIRNVIVWQPIGKAAEPFQKVEGCSFTIALSDNGGVQRARAVDSTQVKTADRGLRLQPIVLRFCV